jgi:hypothetical protein
LRLRFGRNVENSNGFGGGRTGIIGDGAPIKAAVSVIFCLASANFI